MCNLLHLLPFLLADNLCIINFGNNTAAEQTAVVIGTPTCLERGKNMKEGYLCVDHMQQNDRSSSLKVRLCRKIVLRFNLGLHVRFILVRSRISVTARLTVNHRDILVITIDLISRLKVLKLSVQSVFINTPHISQVTHRLQQKEIDARQSSRDGSLPVQPVKFLWLMVSCVEAVVKSSSSLNASPSWDFVNKFFLTTVVEKWTVLARTVVGESPQK
jgi:hypothetical protein